MTNYESYLVLFKTAGVAHTRHTLNLAIYWSKYNPEIHKNAVKFHIKIKDKIATAEFIGFENKYFLHYKGVYKK